MCVLCMFYVDWELGGRKNFRVGIYLNKNLLGWVIGNKQLFLGLSVFKNGNVPINTYY